MAPKNRWVEFSTEEIIELLQGIQLRRLSSLIVEELYEELDLEFATRTAAHVLPWHFIG